MFCHLYPLCGFAILSFGICNHGIMGQYSQLNQCEWRIESYQKNKIILFSSKICNLMVLMFTHKQNCTSIMFTCTFSFIDLI
jgi:hypothetical protein